jgi:hypothetical protein
MLAFLCSGYVMCEPASLSEYQCMISRPLQGNPVSQTTFGRAQAKQIQWRPIAFRTAST